MSSYSYTISDVNLEKLEKEIEINVSIITTLSYTIFNSPDLSIVFVSALSGSEKTALDTIVTNHVTTGYVSISTLSVLDLRCVGAVTDSSGLSPNPGDFWVINGTGTNAFTGYNQQLAFWNGIFWDFYAPMNGDKVLDVVNATFWVYSSVVSSWVPFKRNVTGQNNQSFSSPNEQSNSTAVYNIAATFTSTTLPTGTYFVSWYFEISGSVANVFGALGSAGTQVGVQVFFNGVQITGRTGTGSANSADLTDLVGQDWHQYNGTYVSGSISGTPAIVIKWSRISNGTAYIRNIIANIFRMS